MNLSVTSESTYTEKSCFISFGKGRHLQHAKGYESAAMMKHRDESVWKTTGRKVDRLGVWAGAHKCHQITV